jgi:hypothetical protein
MGDKYNLGQDNPVIVINVSEIAKLIRCTDFARKDIANTVETIWKRNKPSTYRSSNARRAVSSMNKFIGSTMVVDTPTRMTPTDAKDMEASYKVAVQIKEDREKEELKTQIQAVMTGNLSETEKQEIIQGIVNESDLTSTTSTSGDILTQIDNMELKEKKHMLEYYGGVARKTLGTCEESTVQELYREKTGKTIQENNSQTLIQRYKTRNGHIFEVRGKIDGLVPYFENNQPKFKLIEIKNRAQRLFNSIPRYEMIQLCFYLWLLKLDRGELVERFEDTIKIHPCVQDLELYKKSRIVLSRCVDYIIDLWSSADQVKKYQALSTDDRNKYLNREMPMFI